MVRAAAVALLLLLSGCAARPEKVCIAPGTNETVLSLIYGKVQTTLEGTEWPAPASRDGLAKEIRRLREEQFMTLELPRLGTFDKVTRRATCVVDVHFHLAAADRSPERQGALPSLGLDGWTLPDGLYHSQASTPIQFESQPTPDAKGRFVAIGDVAEPVSAVYAVALGRALRPDVKHDPIGEHPISR